MKKRLGLFTALTVLIVISAGCAANKEASFFIMTALPGGDYTDYNEQPVYSFPKSFPDGFSLAYDEEFPETYLEIGYIGCRSRKIAQFSLGGRDYTLIVPKLPSAIKEYAEKNGYSALKMNVAPHGESYSEEQYNEVYFYTGRIKLRVAGKSKDDINAAAWLKPRNTVFGNDTVDRRGDFSIGPDLLYYSSLIYEPVVNRLSLCAHCETAAYYRETGECTIKHTEDGLYMSDEEAEYYLGIIDEQNRNFGRPVSEVIKDLRVSEEYDGQP